MKGKGRERARDEREIIQVEWTLIKAKLTGREGGRRTKRQVKVSD